MKKAVRVTLEIGNLRSFKGLMGGEGTVRKTGTITSRAARNWGSMGGELKGAWEGSGGGVGGGKEQEGRLGKREEELQRPWWCGHFLVVPNFLWLPSCVLIWEDRTVPAS